MSKPTFGNYETQQAIRAMELQGHDPLVDDATFEKIAKALGRKSRPLGDCEAMLDWERQSHADTKARLEALEDAIEMYRASNSKLKEQSKGAKKWIKNLI